MPPRCYKHPKISQIIRGSREKHLLDEFRLQNTALTAELIAEIDDAWRIYLHSQLTKALSQEDLPKEGNEGNSWAELVAKSQNLEWRLECRKRDEKFDMYLKALVSELLYSENLY